MLIPEWREFAHRKDGKEARYWLSSGPVIGDDGKPRGYVTWWSANNYLRQLESSYSVESGKFKLPTVLQTIHAGDTNTEMAASIMSYPRQLQRQLVVNSGAQTTTDKYVFVDKDTGASIPQSRTPRVIMPWQVYSEGDFFNPRTVVIASAFDIPFPIDRGVSDPPFTFDAVDLDTETGFPAKLTPNGKYNIWFGDRSEIYSLIVGPNRVHGAVNCNAVNFAEDLDGFKVVWEG
ncbi:MAG: hypothetical protein HY512_02880 [Candidatus Aenigmarchaeota archaeon]|nr:hypothetical protein [Candidatus Aenigmarchaeota archaeon]